MRACVHACVRACVQAGVRTHDSDALALLDLQVGVVEQLAVLVAVREAPHAEHALPQVLRAGEGEPAAEHLASECLPDSGNICLWTACLRSCIAQS